MNPEWVAHPGNDGFYLQVSLLLVLVVAVQCKILNHAPYFFAALFLVGLVETAIGMWQLSIYVSNPTVPMKTAMIGTLGTPNGLGLLLVLALIAGVILFKTTAKKWIQIGIAAGLLFLLSGIVLSQSRGAVLALFATGLFAGFMMIYSSKSDRARNLKRYKIPVLLGIAVFIAGAGYGLYVMDKESSQGRFMVWEITGEMIKEQPVTGLGQGNYAVEYLNYQADFMSDSTNTHLHHKAANLKQAHNEFLQAFAEGGLPGGMLFLLIWLLPLVYRVKRFLINKKSDWNLIGALAIHTAIITHSMVDSPLHVLPVALIGYINLAMIPIPGKEFRLSSIKKGLIVSILILYTGFLAYRVIQLYPGYHHWKQGVELAEQRAWKPAVFHYKKALDRFSKKGQLEHHLGSAMIFDGQYSRGIYYLNQAKKDFNDRNIYLSESYANIQLKKYKEAEALAKQALSMFPDHLAPHLLLGEIYYYKGEIGQSKTSLEKCINMKTSNISPGVEQISREAREFWRKKYGRVP